MCGIIGYVGEREAQPILLEGLRRLEYPGYDSAGLALPRASPLLAPLPRRDPPPAPRPPRRGAAGLRVDRPRNLAKSVTVE